MFSRAFQEQAKIDPSGAMCNIFFLESHLIRSQYAGFLRKCGKFGLNLPIADTFTAFTCTIGLPVHIWRVYRCRGRLFHEEHIFKS